jgi:hypothetical protein
LSDGENARFIVNVLLKTDTTKKFLADLRLIILEINGTTQRFCMIYQVVFSHVKLPHLGKDWPSPNIFRHGGFGTHLSACKIPSSILGGKNGLMEKF